MSERFSRAMYGDHLAGNVTTNQGTVDVLTFAILSKWHDERYALQNTIFGIAGDVKSAELVTFRYWTRNSLRHCSLS